MATLKGQNLRILIGDSCVAMATNCTITLTGNTDDASTKDDTGMASKPTITSKSWSVSVESLSVADAAAMLTAIRLMTPFTLTWDETATSDNQTAQKAAYSRTGKAYLNDVTFNFNDRENSTKSLQFTGSGALEKGTITNTTPVTASAYTKGQFVRLFLSDDNTAAATKVIAAAKSLSMHVSLSLEDATTKDTVGGQDLSTMEAIYEASSPVKWKIANVSGANNRTADTTIVSGSAVLTQLTINGQNRQNATYDAQLNGYGDYSVGA